MIGYYESLIDGKISIVGDDGHIYTREEYADMLEDAVRDAHGPSDDPDRAPSRMR
ncbi:hypothetical protein AB0M45_18120 [Nocardia sp. NPDC051787]|uniref:hypothetical protein n=1 Tax=Nocardia sp. NPDC051787 TaxID=3155415 RepID=UPI0034271597